ncbi:pyridoxal phosphate-dependent decarboxylase family protein [Profundibacter sp.]|uniref:pyridoxal phosphate-dependent decarboxylase family protein n=1 Tax=Profundibacter sp. TaxID=3101071 RepID=UPI003D10B8C8
MTDTLDPENWTQTRAAAHRMLDAALDKIEHATEGPVWQPLPDDLKQALQAPLPQQGAGVAAMQARAQTLLPYGVGNTHPRFFGWVHGAGAASGLIAEIAASAMNANLGGRDHGAIYVEKQVVDWVRQMFGFPDVASGLVVSGTSMATIIALKVARENALGLATRSDGVGAHRLVGYASSQAHNCVARAFDLLGLGAGALRSVPVNAAYEMDQSALAEMIAQDRAKGMQPFLVVGTAGSVNVGAFDDLEALADLATKQDMWLHVDGAFGAAGVLSETLRPRLKGVERADSLAFDFHKWLHVNYDAGFVMVRDGAAHLATFSSRPDYLQAAGRGLAAGNPWPVEYGPELSRGFRALKIWAQLVEHGTDKLGAMISKNCAQARYLARLVQDQPALTLLAPVASSIVCLRYGDSDVVNGEIVMRLQESGIAAPSVTTLDGKTAIRVNITNHRTRNCDLDLLVDEVVRLGKSLT